MTWIALSLLSALLLGVYDVFKKQSVHANAVIPVLFLSVVTSSMVWLIPTGMSLGGHLVEGPLYVSDLELRGHLELFAKSALVASSWILAYFAVKHLPLSIVGPIRSTGPFWTLAGAILLLGERPNTQQFLGILVTLGAFIAFSFVGSREGIRFHRNKWVYAIVGGTVLGACSGLYDKYLLGIRGYDAATVQAWFSHYLVLVLLPVYLGWYYRLWPRGVFQWRWSIPLIGITLLLADYAYFRALMQPDALVSIVSSLRRTAILVPFAAGFFLYRELNYRFKIPCVLALLAGVLLLVTA